MSPMSMPPPTPAPDVMGPIHAVRCWLAVWHEPAKAVDLQSITGPERWPISGALEAAHRVHAPMPVLAFRQHTAPWPRCDCGIWGLASLGLLARAGVVAMGSPANAPEWEASVIVTGVVALWGRVVRGTEGWRAQYGRPVALLRTVAAGGQQVGWDEARCKLGAKIERLAAKEYGVPLVALSRCPPLTPAWDGWRGPQGLFPFPSHSHHGYGHTTDTADQEEP